MEDNKKPINGSEHPVRTDAGNSDRTVRLAEHFAYSEKFKDLFAYGMDLVEETAHFLDGDGRKAAKGLPKPAAAVYASESMRLTTRLMQLASWLLLQRSAAEGEMTREEILNEKKNVKLNQLHTNLHGPGWDQLPEAFHSLVERSVKLQKRIQRLDEEIYGDKMPETPAVNPVSSQISLLHTAFGGEAKQAVKTWRFTPLHSESGK